MSYWIRASGLSAAAAAGAAALLSRSARRAAPAGVAPMVLRASLVQRPTFRVVRGDDSTDRRSTSASANVASSDKENAHSSSSGDAPSSPTAPFHLAVPVANIAAAREFYGGALGCPEGRSSSTWVDFNIYGHQLVCHEVAGYDAKSTASAVDGDPVPVPHFGLALSVDEFHELASRVEASGIRFELEPHLRFKGQPGEQWTMFFRDPSGNALEFKAMTKPENLFARYTVAS